MTKPQEWLSPRKNARPTAAAAVGAAKGFESITLNWRWQFVLLLFAALVVVHRAFLNGTALGLDDAFITYRFAYNNAHGHWFQWNVGEPPVYGTTTFLYTMILTVVGFFGISIPVASIVISAIAQVGAAYFAYLLVRRWCDDLTGLLAGILIAADGFGINATLGMETYLYIALLLSSLWCYQIERFGWAGALLALLGMTRVDGFALAPILAVHYLILHRRVPWKALLTFGLVLLPWVFASLSWFGSLLPQTLAVKHLHRFVLRTSGEYSLLSLPAKMGIVAVVVLVLFALYGMVRSAGEWKLKSVVLLAAFIGLNVVAYYVSQLPDFDWYYVPQVAAAWLLAAVGVFYIPRLVRWPVSAGFCVLLLIGGYKAFADDPFMRSWKTTPNYVGAQWLKEHGEPGKSLVAAEIGMVGFYNPQLQVHDLMGLVSPEAVPFLGRGQYLEAVEAWHPDYIFLQVNSHYKMTMAIFYPDQWYQLARDRIPTVNEAWLAKYKNFYKDNYQTVATWMQANAKVDYPVGYALGKRKN